MTSNPPVQKVTAAVSQRDARVKRARDGDPGGGGSDSQAEPQHPGARKR